MYFQNFICYIHCIQYECYNLQLICCTLSFSFAQHVNDNFPPNVEEKVEPDDEGKIKEATDSSEPLSRVQVLEDELKNSEWKRMDLIHENMALVNHLNVCQEQKDHTEQENTSLKKRLVSMLSSQVSKVEGFRQSTEVLHKYSPWTINPLCTNLILYTFP